MTKKKNKKHGYTLVELLGVISVLAIIFTIVIYVAMNVINSSKEKSYQITVNSIESYADSYLLENSDRLFYVTMNDDVDNNIDDDVDNNIDDDVQENDDDLVVENVVNKEYQCITVQDLIETGYFDNSVLESNVSKNRKVLEEDYVYVERNADSKTILKTKYLIDENEIIAMCDFAVAATGDVLITYSPNSWSDYKEITINYKVKNYFNIDNYSYYYNFDGGNVEVVTDFGNKKIFKVTDNGTVTGCIKKKSDAKSDGCNKYDNDYIAFGEKVIDTIDKIPPVIVVKNIVKAYGSNFNLFDGVTITDNSELETYDKVYYNGVEITSSKGLPLGDNVLSYISTDKFGNISEEVSRIVTIVVPDKEFDYLEEDQFYPVEADGTYIIEAYGAQGGNNGGLGGYVKAEIQLIEGQQLVINTGGINGYNGGGGYGNKNYNPGGGATTVKLSDTNIVIAAGGGGKGAADSAGVGGSENANGGATVGAGAGKNGSNGGGGSSSPNHKYDCNCDTCGGGCKGYVKCNCHYIGINNDHRTCDRCCSGYYSTYSCNCDTCTKKGKSGNGGSNKVNSPAVSISNESGLRSGNGYAKISYKLG